MGFIYPEIDINMCIDCGMCKKVCAFQSATELRKPLKVLGAAEKSMDIKNSASGGIATILADEIISQGGVVFGASFAEKDGQISVKHIPVKSKKDLLKLKGSKYVQSDMLDVFENIQILLNNGEKAIFIGTPCQTDAVRAFLRKDYDTLILVDIICHGVPNIDFFQNYLDYLGKTRGGRIKDFKFRDKYAGWGLNASVIYDVDGREYKEFIDASESSYYTMFLSAEIYRQNCYNCKYACNKRCGDITLGDFWGVEKEHKEELAENEEIHIQDGFSVVLLNSQKGMDLWEECSKKTFYFESTFEKASNYNQQLCRPSKMGKNRLKIFAKYKEGGYEAVEKFYGPILKRKKIFSLLKKSIPEPIKQRLRNMVRNMTSI